MADYFLHDIDIPAPNRALTAVLRSERMRSIVFETAELAQALYRETVTKRSGRLAASAHVSTEIGGVRNDRHIGVLTVGVGAQGTVEYAAAHEFGADIQVFGSEETVELHPAHDLNRVLEELDSIW